MGASHGAQQSVVESEKSGLEPESFQFPVPPIRTQEDDKNTPIDVSQTLTADQVNSLRVQNSGRATQKLVSLSWDPTLQAHAQTWANHLASIDQMVHSTAAQRPGEGENLAYAYSSTGVVSPLTRAAQLWMAEFPNYHGEAIPQGDFAGYGHYTQCMWSTTTRVALACATSARCYVYTVARYSPPGNYTGQKPY